MFYIKFYCTVNITVQVHNPYFNLQIHFYLILLLLQSFVFLYEPIILRLTRISARYTNALFLPVVLFQHSRCVRCILETIVCRKRKITSSYPLHTKRIAPNNSYLTLTIPEKIYKLFFRIRSYEFYFKINYTYVQLYFFNFNLAISFFCDVQQLFFSIYKN